jgi:hypothetical protein
MIFESSYWRDHLFKQARFLHDKQSQRKWTESSFSRLERELMIGFYSVRKLAEAQKISSALYKQPVKLLSYRSTGRSVEHLNWHKLDELYQLSSADSIEKPLSFVTNQIIHSFVFMPIFNSRRGVELIAFNSDQSKGKNLFAIKLSVVAKLFAKVAGGYIGETQYARLTADGELELVSAKP